MLDLVHTLSEILLQKELKLVTAESCTGGMLSAVITERPGSSNVFDRGFVTYSNESKETMLGVSKNILRHYGAVSSQCAGAMAMCAIKKSKVAEISVAITGIAGPEGGSAEKPVGLVYIATCVTGKEPVITENYFAGDRQEIRESACRKGLSMLIEAASDV